jgi:hypothetical protein
MGDNTIKPSATTVTYQATAPVAPAGVQAAPPAGTTATPPSTPAPVADQATVAQTGSSTTTVSLVDGPQQTSPQPIAVEGPAQGPFEYNDRAVTMFNQFAASGKVHAGRIPTMDRQAAISFSNDLLGKIMLANGASPDAVAAELAKSDSIKTLQQVTGARVDGRFGPETLYKTIQLVQTLVQASDTPEKLAKSKEVIAAFGGKVRGLDDMLAAQTLRVGQTLISGATSLEQLAQVETKLKPVLDGNPTLQSMVTTKRGALTAEVDRAAAAARAEQEAANAAKSKAEADAANKAKAEADAAKTAAEAKTEQTRVSERQGAIDVAMTPVKDTSKDDNVARHLVAKGYNKDATTSQKVTLIKAMLDGATGDDDEKAIIAILKDDIGSGKINETLTALGKKGVNQLFDDLDGAENDALLGALYTAGNVSKEHLTTISSRIVSEGYEGKLVELAKGKRGTLSDVAAPVVLNHLLNSAPAGKDEAVRALKTRIGMEGLLKGKVDMTRLYGHMGKDKDKAAFVVDILKAADSLQAKISTFAIPANAEAAQKANAELKELEAARDYALTQAKSTIANADDDQTVEFMKAMVGPADKPRSLRSFANLPEPLLTQLHKNLDGFWNNTWKTDEEKQYRQIVEDALAVKRRAAFGSDGDASAVPGSAANGYSSGSGIATATAAPAPGTTIEAPGAPAATAQTATAPAPAATVPTATAPAPTAPEPAAPGAAASVATAPKKSPNND